MALCRNCKIKERPKGRAFRYCAECAIKVKLEKHRIVNRKYESENKEKRKQYRHEYDRSKIGKEKYARYRSTRHYKDLAYQRYHTAKENIRKAHYNVTNAIRDGKLKRSKVCVNCGTKDWGKKRSMIEAHHYKGYDKEHWLDVQWLCVPCHRKADTKEVLLGL